MCSASHLHGHDSTEWASVGWVDNLDEADTRLATDGTSAGSAGWDGSSEGVVLVDVGGTLNYTQVDESASNQGALLGSSNVTLGTWDLLGDCELGTGGEGTGTSGVKDGSVWTSSVSGDDVHGS
jgi:hypothetical protein